MRRTRGFRIALGTLGVLRDAARESPFAAEWLEESRPPYFSFFSILRFPR